MANVEIRGLTKRFGPFVALNGLDLDIRDGEFLCVVGPSGCGKTTLLRALAGLEGVNGGEIRFDGELMSSAERHVRPERRNVGMVFQSYALWPHMSVADNAAFPLKVAKVDRRDRARRVGEALSAVRLEHLAERYPHELSGGQQQRVALARCLTQAPGMICMDEPLANLDMHLREEMLAEFRRFHQATAASILYITHDQAEAMSIADRIAVLFGGKLQQVASPQVLYDRPLNAAVAGFIGSGRIIQAQVTNAEPLQVSFANMPLRVESAKPVKPGERMFLVVRPEQITLGEGRFRARVASCVYLGGGYRVELEVEHEGAVAALRAFSPIRVEKGEAAPFSLSKVWAMDG